MKQKFSEKERLLKISETAVNELAARIRQRDQILSNCRTDFTKEIAELKGEILNKEILIKKDRLESEKVINQLKGEIQSYAQNTNFLKLNGTISGLEEEVASLTDKIRSYEITVKDLQQEIHTRTTEYETVLIRNAELTTDCRRLSEMTRVTPRNSLSKESALELKKEVSKLQEILGKITKDGDKELAVDGTGFKPSNGEDEDKQHTTYKIMIYEEKLKALEHRLAHISREFEKEITRTTRLEIDNIKLQKLVDHMKLNYATNIEEINGNNRGSFISCETTSESLISTDPGLRARNVSFSHATIGGNSIIIENYPCQNLSFPLENTIEDLAKYIGICVDKLDILKVDIVGRNNHKSIERVSLLVQLANNDIKTKFLVNKNALARSSIQFLRSLWIKEYHDDKNGFNDDIVSTNNTIFAKKNKTDSKSRLQVDELLTNQQHSFIETIHGSINRTSTNNEHASCESLNTGRRKSHQHECTANSIIVQNYPYKNLIFPLENTIEHLAKIIHIHLCKEQDILKVNIVGSVRRKKENVSLFIQFKTHAMKLTFLECQNVLSESNIAFLKTLQIKEYQDERVRRVFTYAKEKLSEKGYNDILLTNNQVFVKKNKSDSRVMQIHTLQEVEELLQTPLMYSESESDSSIDEASELLGIKIRKRQPLDVNDRKDIVDEVTELLVLTDL